MIANLRRIITVLVALVIVFQVSPVYADNLGDSHSFNVNEEYDAYKRSSIVATLRHVGRHAYFYVDDKYWNEVLNKTQRETAATQLQALAEEFDNVIYPTETSALGSEPNPGVDQDSHITVLLEHVVDGNGGYFESVNAYRKEQAPESNEREMITISAKTLGSDILKSFLAHEFQHLISFQQKELSTNSSEETWLNELRSEYATTLVGYSEPYAKSGLARRVDLFLNNSTDSLTEWPNTTQDYATATVFGHYLVGRYGLGILSETLRMPINGIKSIEKYLEDKGTPDKFHKIFGDWMVANYINDARTDSRYGYSQQNLQSLRVAPLYKSFLSGSSSASTAYAIKGWQAILHEFSLYQPLDGDSGLKIEFNSIPGERFPLAVILFYDDGSFGIHNGEPLDGANVMYVLNPDVSSTGLSKKLTKIVFAMSHIPSEQNIDGPYTAKNLSSSVSYVSLSDVELALSSAGQNVRALGDQSVIDGSLIKRNNIEPEMYVVQGKYKRYLRPEIIKLYGHLDSALVIPLAGQAFDSYTTANYVRGVNDKKVYAIWPDGTKHWMNITASEWDASGRDWGAIFIVNDSELLSYRTGVDIIR